MPPPVTADWSQVKATAIATGSLIDAADHHGLRYEAVKTRACREQWPVGRRVVRQLEEAKANADRQITLAGNASVTSVVTSVTSSSQAILQSLGEDRVATKMAASRASRRVFESLDKLEPSAILQDAGKLRDMATVAEKSQDWQSGQQQVTVNIFDDAIKPADAIEVESQVVDNQ